MNADTHTDALKMAKGMLVEHQSALRAAAEVNGDSLWDVETTLRETATRCVENADELVAWRAQRDADLVARFSPPARREPRARAS